MLRKLKNVAKWFRDQARLALFRWTNRPRGPFAMCIKPLWHGELQGYENLYKAITLEGETGADMPRLYMFAANVRRLESQGVPGAIAELGVYRGKTARLMHLLAPSRRMYLFDTFEGLPERDLAVDPAASKEVVCANTSIELVRGRVGKGADMVFCPGYFPETASAVPEGERFALVHLDTDLYAPTLAGLEFFSERMSPGGIILIHDYGTPNWPGVRQAVDEFCAHRPETPVLMPDGAGTAVIAPCKTP